MAGELPARYTRYRVLRKYMYLKRPAVSESVALRRNQV